MKKILTEPIRFYQKHISSRTPPSCRYHPTCSSYALQAIEKHGAVKGGIMGAARIIRCNPFVEGGVDEVPDHFTVRRNPDNVDDYYIPEYMMLNDKQAQEEFEELLEKYEAELIVTEQLPSPSTTLHQVADVKPLSKEDVKKRFTKDELKHLVDIEIFPEWDSKQYQYYTLEKTAKNKSFLKSIESFDEDTDLGRELPLAVLEKTGIWYTNLPTLGREFIIQHGVTPQDIKNKNYHLWLVLKAMDEIHKED